MSERRCYGCGAEVGEREVVGRRDACLGCGADLHCCLNCDFHDPALHNECREPQAERQVDKERGNFCEYFRFRTRSAAGNRQAGGARAQLDALFAKGKR